MSLNLNGKSILITGGTGSFGKAFTKAVLDKWPDVKRLVIYSRDEQKQFQMAFEYPAFGQQRTCNELRKKGIFISAGGVRSVWQRHDLEVFDKRLKRIGYEADTDEGSFAKKSGSKIAAISKEKDECCSQNSECSVPSHRGFSVSQYANGNNNQNNSDSWQ